METGARLSLLNICYDDVTSLRLDQVDDKLQRLWLGYTFALFDTRNNYISEAKYNVYNELKQTSPEGNENILHILYEYVRIGDINNYAISILVYSETMGKEIFKATSTYIDYEVIDGNLRLYVGNGASSFGELVIYNITSDTIYNFNDSAVLAKKEMSTDFKEELVIYNEEQTSVYVLKAGVKMSMQEAISTYHTEVKEDVAGYTAIDNNGQTIWFDKLGRYEYTHGQYWKNILNKTSARIEKSVQGYKKKAEAKVGRKRGRMGQGSGKHNSGCNWEGSK